MERYPLIAGDSKHSVTSGSGSGSGSGSAAVIAVTPHCDGNPSIRIPVRQRENNNDAVDSTTTTATTTTAITTTTTPTTTTPTTTTELDESYQASADYHWGSLNGGSEVYPGGSQYQLAGGPFGFQTSVRLPGAMCLLQRDFSHAGDVCIQRLQNCTDGLSFSLWHKAHYDAELMYSNQYLPRQALISTGGDIQGTPGLLVYLQNHVLGVVVSSGELHWRLSVSALLVNHAWNSIGVRWQAPSVADQPVQGLQLFINGQRVAAVVNGLPTTPRPPVEPVQLMVGCHKTSSYGLMSDFCTGCEMDEVAIWLRALPDDQLHLFNGGHKLPQELSPQEFGSIVSQVNLQDIEQQQQAVQVLLGVLSKPDSGTDADDAAGEADMEKLSGIMETMTDLDTVKRSQTAEELDKFADIVKVQDLLLRQKNKNRWESLEEKARKTKKDEKKPKDAAGMVRAMEDWVMASVTRVALKDENDTVLVNKKTDNIQLTMQKMKLKRFKRNELASFPEGQNKKADTVELPTHVFNKAGCDDAPISIVFGKYDTLGAVAPRRVAESGEMTSRSPELVDIDSAVVSLRVSVSEDEDEDEDGVEDGAESGDLSRCLPTKEQLKWAPVKSQLTHKTPTPALRKTLFHTEVKSDILRRLCVWWNPELSDGVGGWDPTGCRATDDSTELVTICACDNFGQYAVMTEKVEPKRVPVEEDPARYIKYLLYSISGVLLLFFILVVSCNVRVGDMFHQLRQHTALALLAAALCTCLSDLESVRQDRHSCATIAACAQFFQLAVGVLLACEGYANFRAVIEGTVSGKYGTYVCFAWGLPSLLVGYTLVSALPQLGDDPRCVLGWSASLKTRALLAPLLLALAVALAAAAVAACNAGHARARPELRAELRSVCRGHAIFTVLHLVNWGLALLCYVLLAGDDSQEAGIIYSVFQTFSALQGVFFFLLMGFMSNRFHQALPCTGRPQPQRQVERQ